LKVKLFPKQHSQQWWENNMSDNIHPSAIIEKGAEIGKNVKIGPYSVIGSKVKIADNNIVKSHVVISGNTIIGEGNEIYPFASIGEKTQDLKYKGADTQLIIGENNQIREYVTMNPGTEEGTKTIVGNNCLFMISSHIAHDCVIGDNVIMANNATLAGHVTVGDFAIIGGLSAVRQFVRIGEHAMIGGMTGVEDDVIPYGMVYGSRPGLMGLNLVGLKRRNFEREEITNLRKAYEIIFENDEHNFSASVAKVKKEFPKDETILRIVEFIESAKDRPICKKR